MKNSLKRTSSQPNFPKVFKNIKFRKQSSNIINYKELSKLQNSTLKNYKSRETSLSYSSISENDRKKNKNLIISKVYEILRRKKSFSDLSNKSLNERIEDEMFNQFFIKKKNGLEGVNFKPEKRTTFNKEKLLNKIIRDYNDQKFYNFSQIQHEKDKFEKTIEMMNKGKEYQKKRISQEIENFYSLRDKVYHYKRFRYENYIKRIKTNNKILNKSTSINNNINLNKFLNNIKKKNSNKSKGYSKSFSQSLSDIQNNEYESINKRKEYDNYKSNHLLRPIKLYSFNKYNNYDLEDDDLDEHNLKYLQKINNELYIKIPKIIQGTLPIWCKKKFSKKTISKFKGLTGKYF